MFAKFGVFAKIVVIFETFCNLLLQKYLNELVLLNPSFVQAMESLAFAVLKCHFLPPLTTFIVKGTIVDSCTLFLDDHCAQYN
jgi:hypothetical protein